MAKDSYWFKHDSTAGRGTRMRKMAFIYGHWGKGIYWDVIEILRDQDGYKFEKDETSIQMLADLIGCKDPVKFENWFNDCIKLDLLQSDKTHFFSNVLNENMGVWETKKTNGGKKKKAKTERIKSENGAKTEHKIIEDKIIEDNNLLKRENLTEMLLNDLPNSTHLETISQRSGLTIEQIKEKIPEFKKSASLEYKTPMDLVNHFLRWLNVKKDSNDKKQYFLCSPHGRWNGFLTQDEFEAKTKTGYWTLEKVI